MYFIKGKVKDGFVIAGRLVFKHLKIEYHLWSSSFGFRFSADENYIFSISIPPVSLYLVFGNGKYREKEISISVHNWAIWWNFWTSFNEWKSSAPKYRNGSFHIDDFLLGKRKYKRTILEDRPVSIPMPEKNYQANIKLCRDTWKRSRWFTQTIMRIDADIIEGIPHEGKGTAEYNCGEDRTWGMCCPATSIADGVGKIVGSVLHDRVRYGGWNDWNYKR